MSRNNRTYRTKDIRHVRFLTSLLFAIYVFLFLYKGFHEQLELFGYAYSSLFELRVSFAPWGVALVATLLLCSIQHLTRSCFNLGFRFLFISYIPALAGLYLFIDQDASSSGHNAIFLRHAVIAGILVLLCLVRIGKYMLSGNETYSSDRSTVSFSSWAIGMLFFFTASFFTIGLFSPLKISTRNEIAMLRAVQNNDYNQVLQIDSNNPKPTLKMTQLRNYALLLKGELGNKLFHYPQNYGKAGIDTSFIARNVSAKNLNSPVSDLQKCDIKLTEALLDKDLNQFISSLDDYTPFYSAEQLPRHYREAYALYVYLHPEKPYVITDKELNDSFIDYLTIRNREAGNKDKQLSDLKKSPYYGSYWWYYDFIDTPKI
ncbi:MAG: DUF6057 family protein [Bacteroidaceae bacterium]|jgi:hypothetical protein